MNQELFKITIKENLETMFPIDVIAVKSGECSFFPHGGEPEYYFIADNTKRNRENNLIIGQRVAAIDETRIPEGFLEKLKTYDQTMDIIKKGVDSEREFELLIADPFELCELFLLHPTY